MGLNRNDLSQLCVASAIESVLASNTTLQELDLGHNRAGPAFIQRILSGIRRNATLTEVNVLGNQAGKENVRIIQSLVSDLSVPLRSASGAWLWHEQGRKGCNRRQGRCLDLSAEISERCTCFKDCHDVLIVASDLQRAATGQIIDVVSLGSVQFSAKLVMNLCLRNCDLDTTSLTLVLASLASNR